MKLRRECAGEAWHLPVPYMTFREKRSFATLSLKEYHHDL